MLMSPIKPFRLALPVLSFILLSLVPIPSSLGQAVTNEHLSWPTEFVPPDLSDRRRPDGRSRGGASRGGCDLPEEQEPLTALVPSTVVSPDPAPDLALENPTPTELPLNDATYEVVLSLTTKPHPDFWFYVPYQLDGDLDLEFVLQDEMGNTLYQSRFAPVFEHPGIISVALSETTLPLALETPYRWFLVAYCEPSSPTFVEGWIQRVELNEAVQEQLAQASPSEQANLYATHGIWQDALMTLGTLYRQHPDSVDARAEWMALLKSAGLGKVATEDLLPTFDATSLAR